MKWFVDFCVWLRWFILGGKKPVVVLNKRQKLKRELAITCEKRWAKAEYQRHFRNAASNMGMLNEAREFWYEQPYEWRRNQEKKWKKKYGKDWRKHVVI